MFKSESAKSRTGARSPGCGLIRFVRSGILRTLAWTRRAALPPRNQGVSFTHLAGYFYLPFACLLFIPDKGEDPVGCAVVKKAVTIGREVNGLYEFRPVIGEVYDLDPLTGLNSCFTECRRVKQPLCVDIDVRN